MREWNEKINFGYLDPGTELVYDPDTEEYQLLSELDEEQWTDYLDDMAGYHVTVEYDHIDDVFRVRT